MKKVTLLVLVIIAGLLTYIAFKPQTPPVYPDQQIVPMGETTTTQNQDESDYVTIPSNQKLISEDSKTIVIKRIISQYPYSSIVECASTTGEITYSVFANNLPPASDPSHDDSIKYDSEGNILQYCAEYLTGGPSDCMRNPGKNCKQIYYYSGVTKKIEVNTYNI